MAMLPNPLPRLADDPTGAELGLSLPPGSLMDTTADGPWPEPLLWCADGPAQPGAWAGLLAGRSVGLLPVLIQEDTTHGGKLADWYLDPGRMSYPGDHDVEEFLAESWAGYVSEEEDPEEELLEVLAPYGQDWPGLAPAPAFDGDPDTTAAGVTAELVASGWLDRPRAALVHARRSADIPAAMGWGGPVNYEDDTGALSAVLRSWEDRYGLRVVALGLDTLTATVAAPPQTVAQAEAIAAEHFAFCPDIITQGRHGSLSTYAAKALLGKNIWHFWWD
ncbi:protein of unknown function [Streptomyces sp. DvalAA-14]|uniref:DUF4253 domain-containing protein n=1 Tax=unclassified Streptomyces TaxID=2593676 RepID=UPI00081B4A66|nr:MULTISPECIES: DUF4253 domain-containing protein [unclassified Streptomyces]MYS19067.1 DUF4253 domain-containing protein [Streptomyces sp. SID4948]SCD35766.1 protein of unknown function [Streptomyces sp. DvalAA-14]